jgi:hypothetical protein
LAANKQLSERAAEDSERERVILDLKHKLAKLESTLEGDAATLSAAVREATESRREVARLRQDLAALTDEVSLNGILYARVSGNLPAAHCSLRASHAYYPLHMALWAPISHAYAQCKAGERICATCGGFARFHPPPASHLHAFHLSSSSCIYACRLIERVLLGSLDRRASTLCEPRQMRLSNDTLRCAHNSIAKQTICSLRRKRLRLSTQVCVCVCVCLCAATRLRPSPLVYHLFCFYHTQSQSYPNIYHHRHRTHHHHHTHLHSPASLLACIASTAACAARALAEEQERKAMAARARADALARKVTSLATELRDADAMLQVSSAA